MHGTDFENIETVDAQGNARSSWIHSANGSYSHSWILKWMPLRF